jgi:sugar O-acyltransferase (sialic acid O-acetyltransferase NeuD family)
MTKRLIILGTGGSAHDVLDVLDALNSNGEGWEAIGFLDDGKPAGSQHWGLPVFGGLSVAPNYKDCFLINTIGSERNYRVRAEIIASCDVAKDRFSTLVHPKSSVSMRSRLGVGVCVNYGVSIGGGAAIGDHVYIGPNAIIGHDSVIGDYSVIAPGAIISGYVKIGASCYIGAGSSIRQSLQIGDKSLIGMGAVVVRSVDTGMTVVGNPAKTLAARSRQDEAKP